MTGQKQQRKQKNYSGKSADKKVIHVAVVLDAWFPQKGKRPGVVGGGQVHVRELTAALEANYPVRFTLFFPAHPYGWYRFLWTVIVMARLGQTHATDRLDLIHSHGLNSGYVSHLMSKWLKIPAVHTVHGSHLMDIKSKSVAARLEKWILTGIPYTAQITTSSNFLKYPNVNNSVTVIHNGVNTAEFDEVETDKNEDPTLIWVGRDSPLKGLTYLRQAILKIRKKLPNLKTKLITGGQLTGKALIKAYKKAHVFVLPSVADGQPIALLEAWAAKLPVVVTAVGENPYMVKDGVNGYVVEPKNVMQLTTAIMKVLRARTKNTQMGQAGYDLVKKEFSWKIAAEKTWSVYQKVLQ